MAQQLALGNALQDNQLADAFSDGVVFDFTEQEPGTGTFEMSSA